MRIKTNDENVPMIFEQLNDNIKKEIILSATLSKVYAHKISREIVNTKVNNQLNSMEVSINRINHKFVEKKSKNYDKIKQELEMALENYEEVLNQLCDKFDEKIEELIFQKVELESSILKKYIEKQNEIKEESEHKEKKGILGSINSAIGKLKEKITQNGQIDTSVINKIEDRKEIENELNIQLQDVEDNEKDIIKIEKEIKNINKQIEKLNEEKIKKIFDAMESENKAISTQIRKPRTFSKITKFFVNKFNTYNVIMKNVIEPMNQKIDEFKVNELESFNGKAKEFNLKEIENKIKEILNGEK